MTPFRALQGFRILLVEDNPGDVGLVREYFDEAELGAPDLDVVGTLVEAVEALEPDRGDPPDAVLLDLNLPDSEGLDTLLAVLGAAPEVPVIVLTGAAQSETGVEAVRQGAQDFLPKDDLTPPLLGRTVRYAIERKRATDQLRRSRDRFRATFRAGPYGLLVASNGIVQDANPQAAHLFGYEPGSLVGREVEVLVPDGLQEAHRTLRREYERGPHTRPPGSDMDLRGRRKDGSEFPMEVSLSPFREAGELRVLVAVQDISDRMERERRIRFQADLLDAVGQAVIATDPEGRIGYWNRAAEELYGWQSEEVLGRDVAEVTIPDMTREQGEDILRRLRDGESWSGEFRVRRRDGTTFPALVTDSPIQDSEGRLEGIIGVSAEITPLVEAREELARKNRALRVLSAANQSVLASESEEELLEEACRVVVEEGGYRFAWIGYAEDDPERTVRPVAWRGEGADYLKGLDVRWSSGPMGEGPSGRAIRTGEPAVASKIASGEGFDPWRDSALQHGFRSSIAIPLVDREECLGCLNIYAAEPDAFDDPEVETLSEVGADLAHGILVHRARGKEAELQERLQEAAKLRAVGQLAGGVAHDFNNYLTVITTLTDLLLQDPEVEDGQAEDLREIRAAAERSSVLTRQLLTFGQRDVRVPRLLDLNRTLEDTAAMLRRLLGEKVSMQLDLDPDLPPVVADRGQMEQIITNLSINARDAMPDGGLLTIRTRCARGGGEGSSRGPARVEPGDVVLEVVDSGGGMAPEVRDRIFEPFFTTKETGTGLGLATVYGIVQESGGEIEVESAPGSGSTFRVILPPSEGMEGMEETPAAAETTADQLEGTETVLLVEDDEAIRSVTRRILEGRGYRVLEAASKAEALQRSRREPDSIHLALVDVVLPDAPGPEVAREVGEQRPSMAVIFTSGYSPDEMRRAASGSSGMAYLEKPFDPETLARVVRDTLDDQAGAGGDAPG